MHAVTHIIVRIARTAAQSIAVCALYIYIWKYAAKKQLIQVENPDLDPSPSNHTVINEYTVIYSHTLRTVRRNTSIDVGTYIHS